MSPTADGLAGRTTTTEYTGTARQAQDRVTEPASPGGLRGGAAAVPPRAAAVPQTSRPAGSQSHLPGGTSTSPLDRGRAVAGMPSPGTGEADPAAGNRLPAALVRGRTQTPALSGAEWRAAAKAAQSKAQRGRPARSAAARPAAKATIPPPVTGGAALTAVATCLGRCDWATGPGDPSEVDKAAERHTTKPPKHPTNTVSVAAETGGAS